MKTLLFAAAMASALVMPVVAEGVRSDAKAAHQAERKEMHEKFRTERLKMKAEHREAFEKVHKGCKESMKAADTPEVKDGIRVKCRAEHDALREKFGLEKEQRIKERRGRMDDFREERRERREDAKGKREELKGQREELKKQHEELKGKRDELRTKRKELHEKAGVAAE